MTCKECLHYQVCAENGIYFTDQYIKGITITNDVRSLCHYFKNRTDYVKVKHGHWEKGGVWGDTGSVAYRCTACGETTYDGDYFIYCPKCGARMENR